MSQYDMWKTHDADYEAAASEADFMQRKLEEHLEAPISQEDVSLMLEDYDYDMEAVLTSMAVASNPWSLAAHQVRFVDLINQHRAKRFAADFDVADYAH